MEHVSFLALKPVALPRSSSLAFPPSSPFAHHRAAPQTRVSSHPRLGPQGGASDARGLAARYPALMQQPLRLSNPASRAEFCTVKSTISGWNGESCYLLSDMQGNIANIEADYSTFQDRSGFVETPFLSDNQGVPSEKIVHSKCNEFLREKCIHNKLLARMLSSTYRSKAFGICCIISSWLKYIIQETVKLYTKEKDKLTKILTDQKVKPNAKSSEMNEGVHSSFLPNLFRKASANNKAGSRCFCKKITLQRCTWGAPFGISSHLRLAKTPNAMAENSNGALEEDKSGSHDKSTFSYLKVVRSKGTLIALLLLAFIFGNKDRITRMLKAAGLDAGQSFILLSSCVCATKSAYEALKEAKDVGELIFFYVKMSKEPKKKQEKSDIDC